MGFFVWFLKNYKHNFNTGGNEFKNWHLYIK